MFCYLCFNDIVYFIRASPCNVPFYYWPLTSEVDLGDMAVEV